MNLYFKFMVFVILFTLPIFAFMYLMLYCEGIMDHESAIFTVFVCWLFGMFMATIKWFYDI